MKKREIPLSENLGHGHLACAGCGAAVSMRLTLKALGEKTVMVFPASCWSIIPGSWPYSSFRIPVVHAGFVTGGATASGIRAALDVRGDRETLVAVWAGDGGTFDIGLQALSGAAERNEDFIYICNDNEGYMNTGTQRSSATPMFAWTTTTPVMKPKENPKKDGEGDENTGDSIHPSSLSLSPGLEDFFRTHHQDFKACCSVKSLSSL
jgi:pyruvate/2-oxoacid:ferredoxin oxidoreductase beta subunit